MAKLQELIKGFRANVRAGIPTGVAFDGKNLYLTADDTKAFVGMSDKPGVEDRDTIIRSPRGTATRAVNLDEIQVPDLWHISTWLKDLDQCRTNDYPHTKHALIHSQLIQAGHDVLETWSLAHDLLWNLRENS